MNLLNLPRSRIIELLSVCSKLKIVLYNTSVSKDCRRNLFVSLYSKRKSVLDGLYFSFKSVGLGLFDRWGLLGREREGFTQDYARTHCERTVKSFLATFQYIVSANARSLVVGMIGTFTRPDHNLEEEVLFPEKRGFSIYTRVERKKEWFFLLMRHCKTMWCKHPNEVPRIFVHRVVENAGISWR